jgi:peptidoglycan/LPS O-acetylase OafA/YrhL
MRDFKLTSIDSTKKQANGLYLRRIPQLDGLRGVAIGLVVIHHYIYQMHPSMPDALSSILIPIAGWGWSGVDLFFVLSGFLIGGILVDEKESENYYSTFYIRRAFRILPIYLLMVVLGFLLFSLGERGGAHLGGLSSPAPWGYYFTFTQNFYFARHSNIMSYLQITWSLAVEEQFYLTLPLLVRKVNKEKLLAVALGMAVFFAVLRSALYGAGYLNAMQAYVLPFCRFDSLFIGVACALLVRSPKPYAWIQKRPRVLTGAALVLGASFLFMSHYLWSKNMPLHTVGFTVVALFYAALMLLVLANPEGLLSRALRYPALMKLGTISYCVYLIHGSVILLIDKLLQLGFHISEAEQWAATLLGAAATFLLAQGSWVFFESRMVALGHNFSYERSRDAEPAAGSA